MEEEKEKGRGEEEKEEKFKLLEGSFLGRAFMGCPGSMGNHPRLWVLWLVLVQYPLTT